MGAYSISSPVDTGVYCVHSPLLEGASYIISPVITGAYSGYREEFISPADAGVCFENQPSSPVVAGAICDLSLNSVDDSFSGQLFEHLMSDECEFMLIHDQSNAMQKFRPILQIIFVRGLLIQLDAKISPILIFKEFVLKRNVVFILVM